MNRDEKYGGSGIYVDTAMSAIAGLTEGLASEAGRGRFSDRMNALSAAAITGAIFALRETLIEIEEGRNSEASDSR